MQNKESGKSYSKSPMGGTPRPQVKDTVSRTVKELPSQREEAMNKLMTAYNSKAYANPYAPLLSSGTQNYTTADGAYHDDTGIYAYNHNGDRLGFVNRDMNTRDGLVYGLGLDNVGDPNRGVYDASFETPVGTVGYGYDGDTTGLTYNPSLNAQKYIFALANLLNR